MTHQPIPQTDGVADHAAPEEPLVKRIRKFIVGAAGLAATFVAAGAFDDTTEAIVTGALAVLTAAGIYAVPNQPAAGDRTT